MQLYEMQVTKTAIIRTAPARIPKGIIGAAVRLSFSPEWEGLHKTVVFRAGEVTKDVLDVENEVVIPAECTEEVGALLEVGVYGVDGENSVAIPTLWAAIGRVCEATDPSGDTTTDPSLPVWAQLLDMIRQLEEQGVTQNEVDQAVRDYFTENPLVETDPTVPAWAKTEGKPSYTAAEVGAAPAGYGYGETLTTILWSDDDGTQLEISLDMFFADPNKLDKVYRFKLVDYPACVVSGMGGFADIMCTDIADGIPRDITIVYYSLYGIATKQKLRGEWYPWEYVSPPLEPGVEYRTTERINNLPVYVQRVNVGVFPEADGASVEVKTGIEFGDIVRLSANIGKWSLPFIDRQIVSAGYYTDPEDGKYKIAVFLYTKIDRSLGGAADVTLYYTK